MRTLLMPYVAFVALLSCLGHKEWRFVVYVVPVWNIVGAKGAAWLYVYILVVLNTMD
jgi:alpha-1,6-mannosyltransferase